MILLNDIYLVTVSLYISFIIADMANALFDFSWSVAKGYEWLTVEPSEVQSPDPPRAAWVLREVPDQAARSYQPLTDATGLFRTFASARPTKAGVLAFANEYGLLGTRKYLDPDPQEVPDALAGEQVVGERLSDWITHILVMKDAVDVWDLVATKDEAGLKKLQRSRKPFTKPSAHRLAEPAAVEPQHDAYTADGFDRLGYYESPRSASLSDAWTFVMDAVTQHLEETGVEMTMKWSATERTARFYVAPRSLLAAMWVQFAEAVSEQKTYERCRLCGTPFEVSTAQTGKRTNRRFCSDEHKNQFHYEKRTRARQLRDEGATPREIADEYETTVAAVKKWLATGRKPTGKSRKKR